MRKKEVDVIDLKILEILSKEGNISNKKLAEAIGLSPAPTMVRVRNLYKRGIIKGSHVHVNYAYFGYTERYVLELAVLNEHLPLMYQILGEIKSILTVFTATSERTPTHNVTTLGVHFLVKSDEQLESIEQSIKQVPDILVYNLWKTDSMYIEEYPNFFVTEEDL